MKLLFRLYMILFLSFFAFSYYAYALDKNYQNIEDSENKELPQILNDICKDNDGSLGNTTEDYFQGEWIDGYKFIGWKSWYKGDSEYNVTNLPYLIERGNPDTDGLLVHGMSDTQLDGKDYIRLQYTQFTCQCPSGKRDSYGKCVPQEKAQGIKNWGDKKSQIEVCKNGHKIEGVSVTPTGKETYKRWTNNAEFVWGKSWAPSGTNSNNLNYSFKWYDGVLFVEKFTSKPDQNAPGFFSIEINADKYECNCPHGKDPDTNLCLPMDCDAPFFEYPAGVCSEPNLCPDGGYALNGSCDRTCEDVGLFTLNSIVDIFNPSHGKKCTDYLDCDLKKAECITKCGSIDNISNFQCNESLSLTSCQCKDDNLDDNVADPDEIDENSTDDEISNSLLKTIKDDIKKMSQTQGDIEGLLTQSNENDLTRENQLNSIDSKLSNIDGTLNDINSNVDLLKNEINDLEDSQDEGNAILEDIRDINAENRDNNKSLLDKVSDFIDLMTNTDSLNESINNLNMEGKMSGYLDSTLNQFGNVLGISQSYGTRPNNVQVELFNKTYTLVNFSVLDEYINVIRGLFLSIAYVLGFLFFLRKD